MKTITATPKTTTVGLGGTTTIQVNTVDQYGNAIDVQPTVDANAAFTFGEVTQVEKDGQPVAGEYTFTAKALNTGSQTITIKSGDVKETVGVTVAPSSELVKSLVITGSDVNTDGTAKYKLTTGDTTELNATGKDANGNTVSIDQSDIYWTSSNEAVATVDQDGNVTTKNVTEDTPVTITADVLGVKQTITFTVSAGAPKLLAGTLKASSVADLDADVATAGIQLALDGVGTVDHEANGSVQVTFTGLDQYGQSINPTVSSTSYDPTIAKEVESANTVTITAAKAGDTKVRVVVGSDEVLLDVKVTEDAVANAQAAADALAQAVAALHTKLNAANTALTTTTVGTDVGQVSQADHDDLEAAITTAQGVYDARTTKTQTQLDAATTALNDALTTFNSSVIVAGDATALNTKLNAASTALTTTTVGTDVGQVSQADHDDLAAAITTAQDVYDARTTKTQTQLDAATTALNDALTAFNNSVIVAGDETDLSTKLNAANTALTTTTVGTDVGQVSQADHDALAAAIATAQGVYDDRATKTQTQLDAATTALNEALTHLTVL